MTSSFQIVIILFSLAGSVRCADTEWWERWYTWLPVVISFLFALARLYQYYRVRKFAREARERAIEAGQTQPEGFAEEGQPPSYPPSYPPTNPSPSQPFSTSYPSTTDQSFLSSYPSAFGSESGGAAAPPPSYQAAVGQPSASSDSSSYFQSNYGGFTYSDLNNSQKQQRY